MIAAADPHAPDGDSAPGVLPPAGVVVGVDLRGIQNYVYSGHRILDAVGRAALVAEITDTSDAEHGIADLVPKDSTVLRDAGGALTAVFPDRDTAREFTARYTRRLRERAGELTPVVAHVPYGAFPDVEADGVDGALALLPERLRRARRHMSALHTPTPGYGITAVCSASGGPAESVDSSRTQDGHGDVHERVTASVARARGIGRRRHRNHSLGWLVDASTATGAAELSLPMEMGRLGRDHGALSRIAVVHIDVNGLGELLGDHREHVADPRVPGSGALAQRRLSTRIAGLVEGLARVLVRAVAATVHVDPGRTPVIPGVGAGPIELHQERCGTVQIPVRPVVVAGDDLTVVCEARLALSLVRYALEWLDVDPRQVADPTDPRVALHRVLGDAHGEGRYAGRRVSGPKGHGHTTFVPTVGAGVAIQPLGAPLSFGYDMCEAMCRRAKEYRTGLRKTCPTVDDHAVAWTTRHDGVERVLRRLDHDRAATPRRTSLPMTGSAFRRFLDDHLSEKAPGSLLEGGKAHRRSWLLSTFVPLLESGGAPEPELLRRARVIGHPVELPRDWTPGGLLDAVEVMDLYLDPDLTAALEPHRPQPQGRTGAGGPSVVRAGGVPP